MHKNYPHAVSLLAKLQSPPIFDTIFFQTAVMFSIYHLFSSKLRIMNNDLSPAIHFHFDVDEKLTIYFARPKLRKEKILASMWLTVTHL